MKRLNGFTFAEFQKSVGLSVPEALELLYEQMDSEVIYRAGSLYYFTDGSADVRAALEKLKEKK